MTKFHIELINNQSHAVASEGIDFPQYYLAVASYCYEFNCSLNASFNDWQEVITPTSWMHEVNNPPAETIRLYWSGTSQRTLPDRFITIREIEHATNVDPDLVHQSYLRIIQTNGVPPYLKIGHQVTLDTSNLGIGQPNFTGVIETAQAHLIELLITGETEWSRHANGKSTSPASKTNQPSTPHVPSQLARNPSTKRAIPTETRNPQTDPIDTSN